MAERSHIVGRREPARGARHKAGHLQIVVRLPDDTFAEIRKRAVAERTSFGEQVRLLIEWGLESAKETAA